MREIKFRAKVKYNGNHLFSGDWVKGSLIMKSKGVFIYVIEEDEFGNIVREFEFEVHPETVGQFTGLKDKNGVDIWEGDVVSVKTVVTVSDDIFGEQENCEQEIICKVYFSEHFTCFDLETIESDLYLKYWGFYGEKDNYELEVTGNIHDKTK